MSCKLGIFNRGCCVSFPNGKLHVYMKGSVITEGAVDEVFQQRVLCFLSYRTGKLYMSSSVITEGDVSCVFSTEGLCTLLYM